ncbi:MAG: helicase-related protein [Paludibacter sp.]|jgi:superfamily II DNA or RNA helicase/HKD family nuclease
MSRYFITNRDDDTLLKTIDKIFTTPMSSLDFLVGYFYFSGMEQIYKNINDTEMRILVGLDMEKELQNKIYDFDLFLKKRKSSRLDIRNDNYEKLVDLFCNTDYFESKKKIEAFKIYYEKIKNGTLEVRKTKSPSHAKMYIFSYQDEYMQMGDMPGAVITGSSNLTYSGLIGQNEVNVRFNSKTEHQDAKKIFETLWEDAIVLASKEHIEEFEENVIKHIWLEKIIPPYLMYLRALYEYFNIDASKYIRTPHDITNGKFFNLKYQEDAIRQGIKTIKEHNGVIISDVVGLGKSIIASAIAHNLKYRTIIIAPPHLVNQWDDYKEEFGINARVFSRGIIKKALEYYEMRVRENQKWLIIIDEAHNYRNEYTQDYDNLKRLCTGNKVMLLTATPFNNQPADIYSMIKLFQIPTKSTLQTVDNLGQKFKELIYAYKVLKKQQKDKKISSEEVKSAIESIASQIRMIIQPLIIRRSRLDLRGIPEYTKDLKKQNVEFSDVKDPELLDYELGNLENLYVETLQRISHNPKTVIDREDYLVDDNIADEDIDEGDFKAARYKPIMYVKPECEEKVKKLVEDSGFEYNLFKGTQRNLAKFMRTLLVRRFESSQYAFKISLNNMLFNCKNILAWAKKRNTVPVFKKGMLPDIEELYETTSDVILEMIDDELDAAIQRLNARGMFEIKTEYLNEKFFKDLNADIELLENLKNKWDKVTHDPKLKTFAEILKEKLKKEPNRKIVVFSQFADTVEYLGKKLEGGELSVFFYTAKKASALNKEIIRANFDAGYTDYKQIDEYKVLIATDAISEGYNLHRAGTIFNYDIPYNPTRVIQRVGRINRINKKMFDELYIYNYFPTSIGEAETRTKQISTLKMDMIHAIMGEDTKVLTSNEELRAYFVEQYKKQNMADEQKSWDTDYRAKLNQLVNTPEMKEALRLPLRTRTKRKFEKEVENGVLVVAKKKSEIVFKFAKDSENILAISPQDAFKLLESEPDETGYEVSENFEELYNLAKQSLFVTETETDTEKNKRDALDKVRVILQANACNTEYLEDLKTAIEYDALSGYTLRMINRLKPAEYSSLPENISNDYIQKVLRTYDDIDQQGVETLILAQEIENR